MLKEPRKDDATIFSEKVLELYRKRINVGVLKDANLTYSYTGPCGDTIKLYLKINGETIEDASFECIGCIAAVSYTHLTLPTTPYV